MNLLVVRHAIAAPRGGRAPDQARRLTPQGKKRFALEVRGLERLGVRLDRLYHSPWTRAVETAELMAPLLDGESVVTPHLARAPGEALLAELRGRRVAVVGHEPWLSALCAWLVSGAPRPWMALKKGGVAVLEGEPRPEGMQLLALLTPRILRALG